MKRIIFGTVNELAEIPEELLETCDLSNYRERGIPEVEHPKDFWEILDLKKGKRYTNYPTWKPDYYYYRPQCEKLQGYDFDRALPYLAISYLLNCSNWWWRPSNKGIHILAECDLSSMDDQVRQEVCNLRGYEWFWKKKEGREHLPWRKGNNWDAVRLGGYLR